MTIEYISITANIVTRFCSTVKTANTDFKFRTTAKSAIYNCLVLLLATWDESDEDDYEDPGTSSPFQQVSSVSCQCAACQRRHGVCEMLTIRSTTTTVIPALDNNRWSLFQQIMIDKDSLQYLTEKRIINWCKGTYKLYPMRTTGNVIVSINQRCVRQDYD